MKKLALLLGLVCLAYGFYAMITGRVYAIFGGANNVATIATPDSVKAWRTGVPLPDQLPAHDAAYQKSGNGITVPLGLATQLSRALRARSNYPRFPERTSKRCVPEPGVVVTFSKGGTDIDVFFCFECNILVIHERPRGNNTSIKVVGDVDFDSGRARLLRIIKQIFPNDAQIQTLDN